MAKAKSRESREKNFLDIMFEKETNERAIDALEGTESFEDLCFKKNSSKHSHSSLKNEEEDYESFVALVLKNEASPASLRTRYISEFSSDVVAAVADYVSFVKRFL